MVDIRSAASRQWTTLRPRFMKYDECSFRGSVEFDECRNPRYVESDECVK